MHVRSGGCEWVDELGRLRLTSGLHVDSLASQPHYVPQRWLLSLLARRLIQSKRGGVQTLPPILSHRFSEEFFRWVSGHPTFTLVLRAIGTVEFIHHKLHLSAAMGSPQHNATIPGCRSDTDLGRKSWHLLHTAPPGDWECACAMGNEWGGDSLGIRWGEPENKVGAGMGLRTALGAFMLPWKLLLPFAVCLQLLAWSCSWTTLPPGTLLKSTLEVTAPGLKEPSISLTTNVHVTSTQLLSMSCPYLVLWCCKSESLMWFLRLLPIPYVSSE